ncbi:MAG: hypothetical protein AB4040_20400 [Synechococcus sp.]
MILREYEFNFSDNTAIRKLSRTMRYLSCILIALGVVLLISGTVSAWMYRILFPFALSSLQALILIVFGIWTGDSSQAFRKIVETEGHDIANLMAGLGELRKLFTLQLGLLLVAILLVLFTTTFQVVQFLQSSPPVPNQIQVE